MIFVSVKSFQFAKQQKDTLWLLQVNIAEKATVKFGENLFFLRKHSKPMNKSKTKACIDAFINRFNSGFRVAF